MTRGITQNYWRFHQPEAPNLEYGCLPSGKVYVSLRQELTQGVRPFDEVVTDSDLRQAGYFCNYIIDVPVNEGVVHMNEDGRGFWYVPHKNFVGSDKLSYRIVNVMNQTSEPGCITFYVDHEQKPERIEIEPEKIKTTILQDGDADYWVETNDLRKNEVERSVYAYNTVPDDNYALIVTGGYRAKYKVKHEYWLSSLYRPYYTEHVYSGTIPLKILNASRSVDFADYDVFKFTDKLDDESIGMPENWPLLSADGKHVLYDVQMLAGIKLVPIGDNKKTAESSNLLVFVEDDFESYPREISEKTRERLANKSTFFAQLNAEIKKPILFVNGKEVVAVTRTSRTGRSFSNEGLTFDPINEVGQMVNVVDQAYFDPVFDNSVFNTYRNSIAQYDLGSGDTYETRVMSLTFTLADIPAIGGTFALVIDLPDLTGAYVMPGFEPTFLDKNFNSEFVKGFDYKGLLVLEVFNTPVSSKLLDTCQFNITRKFCSNVEYINSLSTCLDSEGNIEFYPVDFSKIRGFAVVPYSDPDKNQVANANLLSSSYITVVAAATNTYSQLSATTRQIAFFGSAEDNIPPAIMYPKELLKWNITPRIAPAVVLAAVHANESNLRMKWRLVPITAPITTDLELETLCEDHREFNSAEWFTQREYRDTISLATYDNWIEPAVARTLHRSAYPEVVSIRHLTPFDHAGDAASLSNSTTEFVAVLDLERLDVNLTEEHLIEFTVYDSLQGKTINASRNTFDTAEAKISIALGYIAVINGVVRFKELQKAISYTGA